MNFGKIRNIVEINEFIVMLKFFYFHFIVFIIRICLFIFLLMKLLNLWLELLLNFVSNQKFIILWLFYYSTIYNNSEVLSQYFSLKHFSQFLLEIYFFSEYMWYDHPHNDLIAILGSQKIRKIIASIYRTWFEKNSWSLRKSFISFEVKHWKHSEK